VREAQEEIGVEIEVERYLGYWDAPERDPRAHNVANAFLCKIVGGELVAGDDAKAVVKVEVKDLDKVEFAFPDHKEMILKALEART
jgi:8-oxo-dGTP diphosphatase